MARNAVIVGGGIAGLSAGLALRRAGWSVEVLERSPELHPIGAGLSLWPNAVRALRALGAGEIADSAGEIESGVNLRRADGSAIYGYEAQTIDERYGAPLVGIHRADLLEGLLSALGEDVVRFGVGASRARDGVVHLSDGGEIAARPGRRRRRAPLRRARAPARAIRPRARPASLRSAGWSPGTARSSPANGGAPAASPGCCPVGAGRVYWYVGYRGDSSGRPGRPWPPSRRATARRSPS